MAIQLLTALTGEVTTPVDADLMLVENAGAHKKMTYLNLKNTLAAAITGSPAGNDTEIQFNNAGAFGTSADIKVVGNYVVTGGDSNVTGFKVLTFDGSQNIMTVDNGGGTAGSFKMFQNGGSAWFNFTTFNALSYINTGQAFGIGTATPHATSGLTVRQRPSVSGPTLSIDADSVGTVANWISFKDSAGAATGSIGHTAASSTMRVQSEAGNVTIQANADVVFSANGASEKMRVLSTGDVGIGTAAPADYLAGVKGLAVRGSTSAGVSLSDSNTAIFWVMWLNGAVSNNLRFYNSSSASSVMELFVDGKISMPSLPTSSPGGSGLLWNNGGVINIT